MGGRIRGEELNQIMQQIEKQINFKTPWLLIASGSLFLIISLILLFTKLDQSLKILPLIPFLLLFFVGLMWLTFAPYIYRERIDKLLIELNNSTLGCRGLAASRLIVGHISITLCAGQFISSIPTNAITLQVLPQMNEHASPYCAGNVVKPQG
eukprot:TRINITY_DN28164_c0_g1_i2.p1 TRINITY_DN28164_c0_g1~~TRINITY_DN28164_c0_g1_i2.p1  ORF type:complete len:153 (+),score=11.13 TRINITY_DN28164_c0_g1_i2:227-685(+)